MKSHEQESMELNPRRPDFTPSLRGGFYTHQTTNSWAATIFDIRTQEKIHWYLGLRQSELTIESRRSALEYHEHLKRNAERRLASRERSLKRIKFLNSLTLGLFPSLLEKIEELEDTVAIAQRDLNTINPYVRDALMELEAAERERNRIIEEHAADLNRDFMDMQIQYSEEALRAAQSYQIATTIWAEQNRLPPDTALMLLTMTPQERRDVLEKQLKIRLELQEAQDPILTAREVLSMLSQQDQEAILIHAAQLAMEGQTATHYPGLKDAESKTTPIHR